MNNETTIKNILDFKNGNGVWSYGKRSGPSQKTIEDAIKVINCCTENKLLDTAAVPDYDDEINISVFKNKKIYIEINISSFRRSSFCRSINGSDNYYIEVDNVNQIIQELEKEYVETSNQKNEQKGNNNLPNL